MKVMGKWNWENSWLAFCLFGLIVLPAALAFLTVPQLDQVLMTSPARSLFLAALFGLGWGFGSVCFGLGVRELGIGLAFSIIMGLTGALGSLIPWLTSPARTLAYTVLLWMGIVIMLVGVVVCSLAGRERERSLGSARAAGGGGGRFMIGLAICITSGILSCFINLGFTYGAEVTQRAEVLGASVTSAPNVLWLIIMSCGFVPNALYCVYLLVSRRSWQKYRAPDAVPYLGLAFLMGTLWVGSLVAYGAGANKIGHLGPSVGWPILMSMSIVTSNLWGAATGEWRGAGSRAVRTMVQGIGILLLAVAIFAWASTKT